MTATTSSAPGAAEAPRPELVTLTIDGVTVSVPKGTLIIRAAEQAGIEIPRFCDHPGLDPVGACRQCLVDVAAPRPDGTLAPFPKPQASCTMTVSPGMVVNTQHTSPVADKAQHGVMELLLINHPLDCPVCDKGGECPLQNQAMSNGRAQTRFDDVKRTFTKPINISTEVLLDRERCIVCQRCTRFSDQVAGDKFINLVERGAMQQIGIYEEQPFQSYFSGNTVQICPVGALTGAAYRFRSRPFDLVSTPSVCEHCASGCALRTDHRRGVVMRRMAIDDPEPSTASGTATRAAGRSNTPTLPDRLELPLIREADGSMRAAGWPEALEVGCRRAAGRQGRRSPRRAGGSPPKTPTPTASSRGSRLGHQRRRLPRAAALCGRGSRLPHRATVVDDRHRLSGGGQRRLVCRPLGRSQRSRCSLGSSPKKSRRLFFSACGGPCARPRPRCMPWPPSPRHVAWIKLSVDQLIPTVPGAESARPGQPDSDGCRSSGPRWVERWQRRHPRG
jgi:ferredoxin